jgi:hypothetical protein
MPQARLPLPPTPPTSWRARRRERDERKNRWRSLEKGPAAATPTKRLSFTDQHIVARRENASVVHDIVWDTRPDLLPEIVRSVRPYVPGFACDELDAARWFPSQSKRKNTAAPHTHNKRGRTKHVVRMDWGPEWFQACFVLESLPAAHGIATASAFISHVSILSPDEDVFPYARSRHAIFRSMERALTLHSLPKQRGLRCDIDASDFGVLAHDLTTLLRCISWLTRCCSTKRLLSFTARRQQDGNPQDKDDAFSFEPWPRPLLQ